MADPKERRLAEIGLRLRPAFWATRLILPRQIRRLELAIARCVALANPTLRTALAAGRECS